MDGRTGGTGPLGSDSERSEARLTIPKKPVRGDIWDVDLNPAKGREQAGFRPALVLSVDAFNAGPAELVVVLPLTRTARKVRWHVPVDPPEGGLSDVSYIKCEDIRSVSIGRFARHRGRVSWQTVQNVEDRIRILLGLT